MSDKPHTCLIPRPTVHEQLPGSFILEPGVAIGADGDARQPAWLLHDALVGTGIRAQVLPTADPAVTIRLRIGDQVMDSPEGYRLTVTPDRVELEGGTAQALARGVQTIRQLLPSTALRRAPVAESAPVIDCCRIEDAPRFSWRGAHLDVARHFMPKSFILKFLDVAALHRLNVVHLHLTDDQGWRIEVPSWPRLTQVGAWRAETVIAGTDTCDGIRHGGYYTLDDLREIVAYAAQRHITVVPETDFPGHVQAALAAYPELGNNGDPVDVRCTWGISKNILAPTDDSLRFARDVLDTVIDIFPSPWIHLGGDECPRDEWRASPNATARATELGLSGVDELQSWFLRQLHDHVTARSRTVVGWDEVLDDGGMPVDTAVMAWRSSDKRREALAAGHDVIMSPREVTYFDYYQSTDPGEPFANGWPVTVDEVAAWEPTAGLEASSLDKVLGVQGQLWSEYMPNPAHLEYMAFPRLCALAEVGWTAAPHRDSADLLQRLRAHLGRLDAVDVNYRPVEVQSRKERSYEG